MMCIYLYLYFIDFLGMSMKNTRRMKKLSQTAPPDHFSRGGRLGESTATHRVPSHFAKTMLEIQLTSKGGTVEHGS